MKSGLAALLICAAASVNAATVSVIVKGLDGRPIQDAVVSIESAATRPGTQPVFNYPRRVAQKDIAFQPYVLLVPKGAAVSFPNLDRVRHQVYSFSKAKRFELKLYGREEDRSITFEQAGTIALGCNIHDRMSGFIKVLDTPYAEKSDASGRAIIRGVPPGRATLRVWHPLAAGKGNETVAPVVIAGDLSREVALRIAR